MSGIKKAIANPVLLGLVALMILAVVAVPKGELIGELSDGHQYLFLEDTVTETCQFGAHNHPHGFVLNKPFPNAREGDKFNITATVAVYDPKTGTYHNVVKTRTETAYELDDNIVVKDPYNGQEVVSCYQFQLVEEAPEQPTEPEQPEEPEEPANVTEPPGPPQEPDEPTLLSSFASVFTKIWDWLSSIIKWLIPGSLEDSGQELYPGDTFTYVFTLTNTESESLPDTEYRDGTYSFLYETDVIFDPNGNQINMEYQEIVTEMIPGSSVNVELNYKIPTTAAPGTYVASSALVVIPYKFNKTSELWEQQPVRTIDNQSVSFTVRQIAGPPTAPDIISILQNIWNSIWSFLKSLFGW